MYHRGLNSRTEFGRERWNLVRYRRRDSTGSYQIQGARNVP
jgi:hypothetical protein